MFTTPEINLMGIYDTGNKTQLLKELCESLRYVYEPELKELMETVIHKLKGITDEQYSEIGFYPEHKFYGEV